MCPIWVPALACRGYRDFRPPAARWNCGGKKKSPPGRKDTMKQIALAIAFTVAAFAAQTTPAAKPAQAPASNAGQSSTTTKKAVKKHHKKAIKKSSEATKSSAVK